MNQLAYPILADSVCQQNFRVFFPNTEICAGYVNSTKDFCGVGALFKEINQSLEITNAAHTVDVKGRIGEIWRMSQSIME